MALATRTDYFRLWTVAKTQSEIRETIHRAIIPSDYYCNWNGAMGYEMTMPPLFTYLRFDELDHIKNINNSGRRGGYYYQYGSLDTTKDYDYYSSIVNYQKGVRS